MPRWAKGALFLACLLTAGAGAYWYFTSRDLTPDLEAALQAASNARAEWEASPQAGPLRYALVEADLKVVEKAIRFEGDTTPGYLSRQGQHHLSEIKELLDRVPPRERGLTHTRLLAYYYAALGRTNQATTGDLETAAEMCEQALADYTGPEHDKLELASVARLLGVTRLLQHRDKDAADALRKATNWYPEDADTHFRYGVALVRLDNEAGGPFMHRAVSEYQRSLAIDPNQGKVWYYLGFAHMRLRDRASAIDAFKKAKDLGYKEAAEALSKLGV